jgi:Leucine-rich repeat (LRR) protein
MKKLYFLVVLAISFATQAQIVNIPDANFKAKLLSASSSNFVAINLNGNWFKIDENNDGEIQESEAAQVLRLYIDSSQISSLVGILYFYNLHTLNCIANQITNLNFLGLTNLSVLRCNNNLITSLNVQGVSSLTQLYCGFNQITTLDLQGLNNLVRLSCENNQMNNIDLIGLSSLTHLFCSDNQISSLNANVCPSLINLTCQNNLLTNVNLNGLTNLLFVSCFNNQITSLDLSGTNPTILRCYNNQITSLDVQGLSNLTEINCSYNQLSTLNIQGLSNLIKVFCDNNQLSTLNIQGLSNLTEFYCSFNQITNVNFQGLISLEILWCNNNQIISLDLQEQNNLQDLYCQNNPLITLLIKNASNEYFVIQNCPNLQYICCDDSELNSVQLNITNLGYTNCHVNSYCSFTPNGTFYTIQGNTKIDSNVNGCDTSDINFPNLNLSITDGTNSGSLISNTSGNYSIPVQAGSHTITPVLENPTYFNISPTSFVANFPTQTSPLNQDFCVTANGVHHDVEVTLVPTNPARPGFDANYTIVYKNKGNQIENGAVTLDFNDAVLDLVSANPSFSSQATNSLVWNYTNLQPFETRTVNLVFNVNSPTETPAVNIGDQLNYTATISPFATDEFLNDNYSGLKQIVVGSYDPNDKTCVEGTTVDPGMIGQYVHYVIRFENTGTYAAQNVVVKDMIDLAKFDVSTLIPLHSSHDFVTRIAGNKVEFIFEGINLPFDDANNDGYVAFKIKTKSNLVVGDTFSNNANIYFDYNFPIMTNTFTTTIQVLKVKDFEFGTHFTLYPNPVKDVLNLHSKDNTTINSIEIYNALGQVVLAVPNAISTVDVSNLQSGSYFVKVNTDLGISNTKFIKE